MSEDNLMHNGKICSSTPNLVDTNCSFVLDSSLLDSEKDVTVDGRLYKQHGSPLEHVYVLKGENGSIQKLVITRKEPLSVDLVETKGLKDADHFVVDRKYGRLKSSPDFMRLIVYLRRDDPISPNIRQTHKLVLLQYRFDDKIHDLPQPPHGNSKNNKKPFQPTKHSVQERIKETSRNNVPSITKQVVNDNIGGYMNAGTAGINIIH